MISSFKFLGYRLFFLKEKKGDTEIWEDAPEHFGRFYPSKFELPSNKVVSSNNVDWYANQLKTILQKKITTYDIKIKAPGICPPRSIFINCLDPIYGHVLYKLASGRALAQKYKNSEVDIIVIVPRNLSFYADFADSQIIVNEPLQRLLEPCLNLMDSVRELASKYVTSEWAFCNTTRIDDQNILFPISHSERKNKNFVTFIHRDDRIWGGFINVQLKKVNKVFYMLKKIFPQMETVVIGTSNKKLKYKVDRNLINYAHSEKDDRIFESICSNSICTFGVHGSHLIIPSYLSESFVELQPSNRLGNSVQAYWPNPNKSTIEVLFTYRILYGDRFLLNIKSDSVYKLIKHLIEDLPGFKARLDPTVIFRSIL